MSDLRFQAPTAHAVDLVDGRGQLLLRYVFKPDTPANEAPRPYAHPLNTLAGETLTNFRPNDHPWHHGLSFTINSLSGTNFWGGPTYRHGEGYVFRGDHGVQRHVSFIQGAPHVLGQRLEWLAAGEVVLLEERRLTARQLSAQTWTLRWQAELRNVSGRTLACANYYSGEGLKGSHYTGLQFRGARELLDEHGDSSIGIAAEGGLAGEAQVHGAAARWLEWRGQKDTSLARVLVRFENPVPLHWFVRPKNPLVAFPFQFDRNLELVPHASFAVDHTLTFTDQ